MRRAGAVSVRLGGREPRLRQKGNPASSGQKPEDPRIKTGDRSDVRQEFARLGPNRFRAFGQAGGRQPFMPRDYLTNPCLFRPIPSVSPIARRIAAAFRRALEAGLSSSERPLCHSFRFLSMSLSLKIFQKMAGRAPTVSFAPDERGRKPIGYVSGQGAKSGNDGPVTVIPCNPRNP
jgi:hypothetical protein